MPFIAACPFCTRKVQVPESALGHSVACKKCQNYFTLAPEDDQPHDASGRAAHQYVIAAQPPNGSPPLHQATTMNEPATMAATKSPQAPNPDTLEHVIVTTPETPRLQLPLRPALLESNNADDLPWNRYALGAMLLSGLALLCAMFGLSSFLTISLTCAALLVAVICMLATPLHASRDRAVLGLGGAAGLALLAYSFF